MLWPTEQNFCENWMSKNLLEEFLLVLDSLQLPSHIGIWFFDYYLPLASWLNKARTMAGKPIIVGICGAQGSGKSTTCHLLTTILTKAFNMNIATLSIDDIYHTRAARCSLSKSLHPLFLTRGVPCTHDVSLGLEVLQGLKKLQSGDYLYIPKFDKATDDRAPQLDWTCKTGPVDIIFFEGWCVGAVPESPDKLIAPINQLEEKQDERGIWRHTANEALRTSYVDLFGMIDYLLLLAVDNFADVLQFRQLQERRLSQSTKAKASSKSQRIMDANEIIRFVMHYERLTRHILREMPHRADLVIQVDHQQLPRDIIINRTL